MGVVAVILARGGSKRLPRKNMLTFAGKPLIQWSIDAAKQSRCVSEIIVSSDDEEILSFARTQHVTALPRPAHLASDTATSADAVAHALEHAGSACNTLLLLQPTSPLRTAADIDAACELMHEKQASAVVSVSTVEHSPLWSNVLPQDLSLDGFIRDEVKNKRSQDLPQYYRLNGAIYLVNRAAFINSNSFMPQGSYAYLMSAERSVDIDTQLDFICAEAVLNFLNGANPHE